MQENAGVSVREIEYFEVHGNTAPARRPQPEQHPAPGGHLRKVPKPRPKTNERALAAAGKRLVASFVLFLVVVAMGVAHLRINAKGYDLNQQIEAKKVELQ